MRDLNTFLKHLKAQDVNKNVPSVSFEVGNFLAQLVRETNAKKILEIGTARGFSTLCLTKNLTTDGKIITYEISQPSFDAAKVNFYRAHAETQITQRFGNILECLKIEQDPAYDLIFIDGHKQETLAIWQKVQAQTNQQTIIVVDDVQKYRHKMNDFFDYLELSPDWLYQILPLDQDDSVLIAWKKENPTPTKFAFLT